MQLIRGQHVDYVAPFPRYHFWHNGDRALSRVVEAYSVGICTCMLRKSAERRATASLDATYDPDRNLVFPNEQFCQTLVHGSP